MSEPQRIPDWALAEVAAWPQDAWGVYQARLLLRDRKRDRARRDYPERRHRGWGDAGPVPFDAEDIVAIEHADG